MITFLGESSAEAHGRDGQSTDLDGFQKADTIVVVVADPWKRPRVRATGSTAISPAEAARRFKNTPYVDKGLPDSQAAEILEILNNDVFKAEARRVLDASLNDHRELGALSVYQSEDGTYKVYSTGTPKSATQMDIAPKDPSRGRLIFDWHPHPRPGQYQRVPSDSDLRNSKGRDAPGVIQWNKSEAWIYNGGCKVAAPSSC